MCVGCVCVCLCMYVSYMVICTTPGCGVTEASRECPVSYFLTSFLIPLRQSLFLDLSGSKWAPEMSSLYLLSPTLLGLQECVSPHPSIYMDVRIWIQAHHAWEEAFLLTEKSLWCVRYHSWRVISFQYNIKVPPIWQIMVLVLVIKLWNKTDYYLDEKGEELKRTR